MARVRQLEYFRVDQGYEATWGTINDTPSWLGLPIDECGVRPENIVDVQDKYTGIIDMLYADVTGQDLAGTMTTQVWPDNASLLFNMGLQRTADEDLYSWSMEAYDASEAEYLRWLGLMCNTFTITCNSADKKLRLTYDWIGKSETTTSSFSIPTFPSAASFEIGDCAFTVDGNSETRIEEFTITVNNNLAPSDARDSSRFRQYVDGGRRTVELTFTYSPQMTTKPRTLVRDRDASQTFQALFNYPGVGSPTDTITIWLAKIVLRTAEPQGGVADVQRVACTADVLANDTSTESIQVTCA